MMAMLLSQWWVWLSLAAVLGIVEVLVPGFVFLGFSIGAVTVGLLLALGVTLPPAWSLVVFAVASLVGYGVVRVALGRTRGDVRIITKDVNDN
jgi:membrane protein implicated in regulation of membrane protease activity